MVSGDIISVPRGSDFEPDYHAFVSKSENLEITELSNGAGFDESSKWSERRILNRFGHRVSQSILLSGLRVKTVGTETFSTSFKDFVTASH